MTTVAVLCEPPRPGDVLQRLVRTSPVTDAGAAELYAALIRDTARAVANSGGELLVNYREIDDPETIDSEETGGVETDLTTPREETDRSAAETELSALLADVVDVEATRFERQVGGSISARAGNTVTHLLEREDVGSVAIVRPEAALLARTDVDGAAMRLRRSEVVLGPSPGGRLYYAGFTDTFDFGDVYAPPALQTMTRRATDADFGVDFLESKPFVDTGADLADVIVSVRARVRASSLVPPHLAAWIRNSDLDVDVVDGIPQLVRYP